MTPVQLPEVPAPAAWAMTDYQPEANTQFTMRADAAEHYASVGLHVEPLYHAAKLREYAIAYGVQLLDEFLRMAAEPVGLECCGRGFGTCCGEPEPVYASSDGVFQAMSERLAELTTPSEHNSDR